MLVKSSDHDPSRWTDQSVSPDVSRLRDAQTSVRSPSIIRSTYDNSYSTLPWQQAVYSQGIGQHGNIGRDVDVHSAEYMANGLTWCRMSASSGPNDDTRHGPFDKANSICFVRSEVLPGLVGGRIAPQLHLFCSQIKRLGFPRSARQTATSLDNGSCWPASTMYTR